MFPQTIAQGSDYVDNSHGLYLIVLGILVPESIFRATVLWMQTKVLWMQAKLAVFSQFDEMVHQSRAGATDVMTQHCGVIHWH